jgi:hypothetical protein
MGAGGGGEAISQMPEAVENFAILQMMITFEQSFASKNMKTFPRDWRASRASPSPVLKS